jgi:hypothetical protein
MFRTDFSRPLCDNLGKKPANHRCAGLTDANGFGEAEPQAEFPQSLPVGELLSQLRKRILQEQPLQPAEDALRHKILGDLDGIRDSCGVADPTQPLESQSLATMLASAIQTNCATGQGDAVLRYSLAQRASLKMLAEEWRAAALAQYMAQAEAYDAVLGGGVDENLRKAARSQLAQRAYIQGSNATAALDWHTYVQRSQWRQGPLLGLPTGLDSLDIAMGGLHGFTFLGGATGIGASTLALCMAVAAIRNRANVAILFLSLHTAKEVLYNRLLCHESAIDYRIAFQTPRSEKTADALQAASDRLLEEVLPRLCVVDHLESAGTGESFADILNRKRAELVKASRAETVLVVIDRFQLLDIPGPAVTAIEADNQRLALLQKLQAGSRTACYPEGDPYLIISEIRKAGRDGLAVTDLLGSTGLGYSAQAVLFLEPHAVQGDDDDRVPLRLSIPKGRDGVRRTELELILDPWRYRFYEPAAHAFRQGHDRTGNASKRRRLAGSPSDDAPLARTRP